MHRHVNTGALERELLATTCQSMEEETLTCTHREARP